MLGHRKYQQNFEKSNKADNTLSVPDAINLEMEVQNKYLDIERVKKNVFNNKRAICNCQISRTMVLYW